jgi:hypothetical protein
VVMKGQGTCHDFLRYFCWEDDLITAIRQNSEVSTWDSS